MPRVVFTPNLERHVRCHTLEVPGKTVREALDAVFEINPPLREYVLDEQGRLRKHVAVFVDNNSLSDPVCLSDALTRTSEIFVMQALSGG